ncbi:MAG: beta-ketoacyl synthase N-terminal-like domain-containing protein [Candidatus Omnitrophota bacterium]
MDKRIVITGAGIISSLGKNKEDFLRNFLSGHLAIKSKIEDFDAVGILGQGGIRTLDRSSLLSLSASKIAIEDANLNIGQLDSSDIGVSLGTMGSIFSGFDFYRVKLLESPRYVNPMQFSNTVVNASAGQIAIRFGLNGFNATISTGACAGMDAIIYASQMIKKSKANIVLAGGVEEYCDEINSVFKLVKGEDISEGAAILILEDLDFALGRKANILAEIIDTCQENRLSRENLEPEQFSIKEKLGNLYSATGAFKTLIASLLIKNNTRNSISLNCSSCLGNYSSITLSKFNAE